MDYRKFNAKTIDEWCKNGWQWGQAISHEAYQKALQGEWEVFLTPTKPVPHSWLGRLAGKKLLGLASGGGQQIPIFSALGARCTVLDYSHEQCQREREFSQKEGYAVEILERDMTEPLPFLDECFDVIFHPVSNCYVEEVEPIFRECFRVLKKGGILLCGLDNGLNYAFDDDQTALQYKLPFNPLRDPQLYEQSVKNGWGIQFSHTMEEQIGGQLKAGFLLTHLYEDTDGEGRLHEYNIPCYLATRAVKPRRGWEQW